MQTLQTYEHPLDVLSKACQWLDHQAIALAIITQIEGGGVRAVGSMMAIAEDGCAVGYLSGGCIDADIVLQAQRRLNTGKYISLRYGAGSPFVDLPLPCGGSIDVQIIPNPDREVLAKARDALLKRTPVSLGLTADGRLVNTPFAKDEGPLSFQARYEPKIRLRLAGRGADCLALGALASTSGLDVDLQLVDEEDVEQAKQFGLDQLTLLQTPEALPPAKDDAWTAFVLMFHDRHWEGALLEQVLSGPAFYIGAVGSRRTHSVRCEALQSIGVCEKAIARIHAPIGLVPSLRAASQIAISALAEIIGAFETRLERTASKTALILLAAGASERFEKGDKLLAELNGESLLGTSAAIGCDLPFARRIAVTADDQAQRDKVLRGKGWDVVTSDDCKNGQAHSLRAGLSDIRSDPSIDFVLILLADMPKVSSQHIKHILLSAASNTEAVFSETYEKPMPPALFARSVFPMLERLEGDRGAKTILGELNQVAMMTLPANQAIDIDTLSDLEHLQVLVNG